MKKTSQKKAAVKRRTERALERIENEKPAILYIYHPINGICTMDYRSLAVAKQAIAQSCRDSRFYSTTAYLECDGIRYGPQDFFAWEQKYWNNSQIGATMELRHSIATSTYRYPEANND